MAGGLLHGVGRPGAPPHDGGSGPEAAFYDFVPADHGASVAVEEPFHLVVEPRLQLRFGLQAVFLHAFLAVGAPLPVLHVHLVAADVYVFVGEEVENLAPHVLAEANHLVLSGAQGRREDGAPARLWEARKAVVVGDGGQAVARHVDFGNDVNAPCPGVGHDVAHLLLRVEAAILLLSPLVRAYPVGGKVEVGVVFGHGTAHADRVLVVERAPAAALREQRILLDLDSPALVVGQVPMELVDFIECEHVEQLLHLIHREEVARAVEFHAAPFEAGLVGDADIGQGPLAAADSPAGLDVVGEELAQGGYSVDDATIVVARDGHALRVDTQPVASGDALSGHRKADVAFAFVVDFDLTTCRSGQQRGEIVGRGAQLRAAAADGDLLGG